MKKAEKAFFNLVYRYNKAKLESYGGRDRDIVDRVNIYRSGNGMFKATIVLIFPVLIFASVSIFVFKFVSSMYGLGYKHDIIFAILLFLVCFFSQIFIFIRYLYFKQTKR